MGTIFVLLFLLGIVWAIAAPIVYYIKNEKIKLFTTVPGILFSAVFLTLAMSFTTVDAGSVGVVRKFGNPVRQLDPGAHLVIPFAETVYPVAVQTRIVKPNEDAGSHDLQIVHFEVTFAYRVDPRFATSILVDLNDDAETRVINPAILEAIKATVAHYDAQDLITQRPAVRDGIENAVKERIAPYHIIAENTSITGLSFSKDYEDAIEAKVTAQQSAEKAKNDLVRIKTEADQRVAQAEGEAQALKAQKEQITPELLQLRTIEMLREKWDGSMPNVVISGNSGAIPMLDVLSAGAKAKAKAN